uniref:Endonuclease/exonuclease/phosphatase domain-containing protein n=1 Tax=Bicosoecida sp. CB-2014 TaxID=1486930 RepID=A0A7S1CQ96_9STRA
MVVARILRRFAKDHFSPVPRDFAQNPAPPSADSIEAAAMAQGGGASRVRVLTQNTWALPIFPDVQERVAGFCAVLARGEWDVVIMQELAMKREINAIIEAGKRGGLVYHHHFIQGVGFPIWLDVMGTGLLVLSRFPIVDAMYRRYSVNGFPHKIEHSDFFGAKGIGMVRLALGGPAGRGLDVYCTHLHARYCDPPPPPKGYVTRDGVRVTWNESKNPLSYDEYASHRAAQAFEAAKFIAATRDPRNLCVLAGDLNMPEKSAGATMVRRLAGRLRDSFREVSDADGFTIDAPDNVHTPAVGAEPPQRIDYVLWSPPTLGTSSGSPRASGGRWWVESSEVCRFVADVKGRRTHVSDHFGVGTELRYAKPGDGVALAQARRRPRPPPSDDAVDIAAVQEACRVVELGVADAAARQYKRQMRALVAVGLLLVMLWALHIDALPDSGLLPALLRGPLMVLLAAYAVGELIMGQYFNKDERFAMQEVLAEMRITVNAMRSGWLRG